MGAYFTLLIYVLGFNFVVGLCLFEYGWSKTRRFRNPNLDLNAIYPAYHRDDALRWQKYRFYPGAVTLLVPRFVLTCIIGLIMWFWLGVFTIGKADDGTPISGCRKTCLSLIFKFHIHLISLFSCFNILHYQYVTDAEVGGYEEYLGSPSEQEFC